MPPENIFEKGRVLGGQTFQRASELVGRSEVFGDAWI